MQTLEELETELRFYERKLKQPIGFAMALQYSKYVEEIKKEIQAEREGMTA